MVLEIASVTFMIPLGLASAGAVRVGQALGRGEPAAAGRAGWIAVMLGAAFMTAAGLVMATFPGPLASLFTTDAGVIALAAAADARRGGLPALRRPARGLDRDDARGRRHPHAGGLHPRRLLGRRPAAGLPAGVHRRVTASSASGSAWRRAWPSPGSPCCSLWNRKADALARGEFALAGAGAGRASIDGETRLNSRAGLRTMNDLGRPPPTRARRSPLLERHKEASP